MPLSRSSKIGIGVLVGIGVLAALAGNAKADDLLPDDDEPDDDEACPPGTHAVPNVDGTSSCVADIVPDDDDIDDPLPPKPPQCNYAGCGPAFDNNHPPATLALQLQQLGYPIDAIAIAGNGSLIAVNPARALVREFQRDSNAVKAGGGVAAIAAAGKLSEDGLYGNATIAAVKRAHDAVNLLNLPWVDIVELA